MNKKKALIQSYKHKALVMSMSAVLSAMICTTVTQASDIEIYQTAKSGDITLMFMLDISGSMGSTDTGATGTRLQRVQEAMRDLLAGNSAKGIAKLDDDKIIGLSTFDYSVGHVRIPARRLGDIVSGTLTQRQLLLNFATNLPKNNGTTPTANAYADVAAYLMGTTTKGVDRSGFTNGSTSGDNRVRDNDKYIQPASLKQTEEIKKCSGQGIYVLTDGEPNQSSTTIASNLMKKALNVNSFSCNNSALPEVNNPTYGQVGAWSCIGNFNQKLLNPNDNPAKIKIKTAVVGFGSTFNGLPNYNKALTQEQNLTNINNATINSTIANDIRNAARWGILGEGGWYSGNSSTDIVNSVNEFISNLGSEIPSVTTGSPVVPRDALNPSSLQDDVYYQQFQPTPDKSYQLWLGNLKKYLLDSDGLIKGKTNPGVLDAEGNLDPNASGFSRVRMSDDQGRIITPTLNNDTKILESAVYDDWASPIIPNQRNADEKTLGSSKFAAMGGMWSRLQLGATSSTANRKLFTNRNATGALGLRQVALNDITGADAYRGYLVSLLGYNIADPSSPPTSVSGVTSLQTLRQVGAVMHSLPVLVTNKGKVTYNPQTKQLESSNRDDYILFGTTQGLLHVVDAKTGVEKFAFVPNEMVENQREAFRSFDTTSGGLNKLYYGVDGPWTVDTQYVVDNSGNLTVGNGKGVNQKGSQVAYGGLRMGGRSYYALDLSNIDSPTLKFHIDPATKKIYRNGEASAEISALGHMGQSWSKPTIGWVNWGGTRKKVMIVGGGYDAGGVDGDARDVNGVKGEYAGYEAHDYNQSNKRGAGVYMFDANNGDLLWWASANASDSSTTATSGPIGVNSAQMQYSVVSEIRAVDRDGDELIDHLYFGDLGGQVFRIDLDNKAANFAGFSKKPVRLLNLSKSNGTQNRFYDMPSFSIYDSDDGNTFAVIAIGSGNRSKPLQDYTSTLSSYEYDAIYSIYDKDVARKDLYDLDLSLNLPNARSYKTKNLTRNELGLITNANKGNNTTLVAPFSTKGGWYYQYDVCTAGLPLAPGQTLNCSSYKKQTEKVFGTPIAMNYRLYVTTFDSSKPGLAGDCGAGVKGESFLNTLCLPYGQCNEPPIREVIGAGIHLPTVSEDPNPDPDPDPDPTDCDPAVENCEDKLPDPGPTSANNYCISTGGRMTLTISGGISTGDSTRMCLIPQRWYEVLSKNS